MHLIALHDTAGSSNPLGISGNYDRITFAPYYLFKDLITIFIFIFVITFCLPLFSIVFSAFLLLILIMKTNSSFSWFSDSSYNGWIKLVL